MYVVFDIFAAFKVKCAFFQKIRWEHLYKESQKSHTVYVDDLLLKKCFACFPTDRRMLWASTDWVKTASIGWYGMFGWLDEIFVTGRAFNTFQPLKMDKTKTTKSLGETEFLFLYLMGSWICPKNTKTY